MKNVIALALAFAPMGEGNGPDPSKIDNPALRQAMEFALKIGVTSLVAAATFKIDGMLFVLGALAGVW